jgi:ABC-type transporter Mla maintaining outer membrane lipid asymmetry ATPase subunit MlaF
MHCHLLKRAIHGASQLGFSPPAHLSYARFTFEQDEITRLGEADLSRVHRKMGFLFQDAALFDSFNLYENLALPLQRLTNKTPDEIDSIVDRVLSDVRLAGDKR